MALIATAGNALVTLSEPSPARRAYAADLGLTIVDAPDELGEGADVVFDASGHTSVAPTLLRWLRVAGTAVVVGAYQPGLHSMDLLSVMFAEMAIVGTRTYQRGDIEAAIELVTTGRLDVHPHPLISTIFPLDTPGRAQPSAPNCPAA